MTPSRRFRLRAGAAIAVVLTLTACNAADGIGTTEPMTSAPVTTSRAGTGTTTATVKPGTVTVLAAASLKNVFTDLAADFEADHAGVTVRLSFAGSADLADQILAGSPADVFAAADEKTMARVTAAGDAGDPALFATNSLTIVTPPDNPAAVDSFDDLASSSIKTVICAPEVPCGAATAKAEQAAGVTIHAVSKESSVTDVLAKVESGEADAGVVYITDATSAGNKVKTIATAELDATLNRYPIAVLTNAPRPDLGNAWQAMVVGPTGRAALGAAGFGAP